MGGGRDPDQPTQPQETMWIKKKTDPTNMSMRHCDREVWDAMEYKGVYAECDSEGRFTFEVAPYDVVQSHNGHNGCWLDFYTIRTADEVAQIHLMPNRFGEGPGYFRVRTWKGATAPVDGTFIFTFKGA